MPITVTTAPESTDLTTLAVVKTTLGISSSDDDTLLSRLISVASSAIGTYLNRDLAQQRVTETLASNGGRLIILSGTPIVTLHGITYEGVTVDSGLYTVLSSNSGFIQHDSAWTSTNCDLDYSFDYTFGYILPSFSTGTRDLPYDIEEATIILVKQQYYSRSRDPGVASEEVPQVYKTQFTSAKSGNIASGQFSNEIETMLLPYRRYSI